MDSERSLRAKILIVDDVEANLIAIEDTISDVDADIYRAESGLKALELVTQHEFALVLLDVQMPEMDGFEAATLMRQNKYSENIPIIFVTAINKEKIHLFKGYQLGAVDYLFKPLDPVILKSKVTIFLNVFYQKTQKLLQAVDDLEEMKLKLEKNNLELIHLASQDSLTGLYNRALFEKEVERVLSFSKRHKEQFVVVFFDIDNFKSINDSYGHPVGDQLLQEVASRLKSQLRGEDFIARLGGDEFAMIFTKFTALEDVAGVANKICQLISQPLKIAEVELHITCSMGIADYPCAGETTSLLIKHADFAMYQAKEKGKNTYVFFNEAISKSYERRLAVENAMKQALDKNEFRLVYQLIYDFSDKKIYGVETLIRWQSDKLGEVLPDEFIPIAEETGFIQPLGRWIIKEACEQFNRWHEAGAPHISYAINLSPNQLLNEDIVAYTKKIMKKNKIPLNTLELELTETALMKQPNFCEKQLEIFNEIGVKVNIDDFGTGYFSLSRLRYLPVHALKIDKSFVQDIFKDKNDAIIIKAILNLANSLGLKTIAEGIESKEQFDFLKENGCSYGQGYYMARPENPDVVLAQLKKGGKLDK